MTGRALVLGSVAVLAAATMAARPGSAATRSPTTRTFPAGTRFFHGTASATPFETSGDGLPGNPVSAWFTRDARVARMIARDDDDGEPGLRPRVLVYRAIRPIGPLLVLRTPRDVARVLRASEHPDAPGWLAWARGRPVSAHRIGPYGLRDAVCDAGHVGWVVPWNYASSRSLFSYGDERVCRPPSVACDDVLICDPTGKMELERVMPVVRLSPRGRPGSPALALAPADADPLVAWFRRRAVGTGHRYHATAAAILRAAVAAPGIRPAVLVERLGLPSSMLSSAAGHLRASGLLQPMGWLVPIGGASTPIWNPLDKRIHRLLVREGPTTSGAMERRIGWEGVERSLHRMRVNGLLHPRAAWWPTPAAVALVERTS